MGCEGSGPSSKEHNSQGGLIFLLNNEQTIIRPTTERRAADITKTQETIPGFRHSSKHSLEQNQAVIPREFLFQTRTVRER
jgi:hypothetical protein